MWSNTDPQDEEDRYPFYPIDSGSPWIAGLCTVLVVGLIAFGFWSAT